MPDYKLQRVGGSKGGTFFVAWQDGGTRKRASLSTKDAATARARLGEYVRQRAFHERSGEQLTVEAIYHAYIEDRERHGTVALSRIRDCWKWLAPQFGQLLPSDISRDACREYAAGRTNRGLSQGSIHVELGYLRAALRFAKREGWLTVEPYIPLPPKPEPRDHYLTRDQARRLLEACKPVAHLHLFVMLGLTTAGRASALLDLTWDRVDFERGLVHLHDPKRFRTRKGRATVPMNDTLRNALQEAQKGALSPYVVEWAGGKVGSVKKALRAAAARAGVKCTPHVLRHTAAVHLAEAGHSMAEIAQFLGHRDSRTTERVYARFSPDYLRKAAKALEIG